MVENEGIASVESDGFILESNRVSQEDLTATFESESTEDTEESPKKKRSKAASELGKAGGKAAAKARKAKAQDNAEANTKEEKPSVDDDSEAKGAQSEGGKKPPKVAKEAEEPVEAKADDEGEEKEAEKPLGKPRDDPRARVQQATRQAAEAKAERDAALAEVREVKERLASLERGEKPESKEASPDGPQPEPQLEDFEDFQTFNKTHTAWVKAETKREILAELGVQSQQSAVDRELAEVSRRYAEAVRGKTDGWSDEIKTLRAEFQLGEGEQPDATNWIANELVFSPESAPALALHLSEHPDVFQRIAALTTPREVSRELAKLEARLEAATAGNGSRREEEVSKAPPPIKPVSGAPYVAEEDLSKDMPFHEYFERANKKLGRFPKR